MSNDKNAQRRLFTITDMTVAYAVSRSKIYEEIAAGRLKAIKLCGRRLIPAEAAEAWVSTAREG